MATVRQQILDKIEARLIADGWFRTVTQDEEDYVLTDDPAANPSVLIQGGGHSGEESEGACSTYEMTVSFAFSVCDKPLAAKLDESYSRIVIAMKQPDRSLDALARDLLEGELSEPDYDWVEGTIVTGEQQLDFTVFYETKGNDPTVAV